MKKATFLKRIIIGAVALTAITVFPVNAFAEDSVSVDTKEDILFTEPIEEDEIISEEVTAEESGIIQASSFETFIEHTYSDEAILLEGESDEIKPDIEGFKEYVLAQLKGKKTEIKVADYNILAKDLKALMADIVNANPDLYYVNGTYKYTYNKLGIVISISPEYAATDSDSAITYESSIKEIIGKTNSSMSDLEKALIAHDWMTLNVEYDYENYCKGTIPWSSYTAEGALVKRIAVCQGYALAYEAVLKRMGISCITVVSRSMNHAWNMVKLDGDWYHVDTTWDDPVNDVKGRAMHKYFMVSDEGMKTSSRNHHGWVSDKTAGNDQYDSEYWVNVDWEIINVSNAWVFADFSNFYKITGSLPGNPLPIYTGGYDQYIEIITGITMVDGVIYISDFGSVYAVDTDVTDGFKTIKKYGDKNTWINGLYSDKGKLYVREYDNQAKEYIDKEIDLSDGDNLVSARFVRDSIKVKSGEKVILTPIMTPEKPSNTDGSRFTWESSDTSIATVSGDGEVTPYNKGICTITATNMDDRTVKATCEITVEEVKYTVKFLDKSGKVISTQSIANTMMAQVPEAPEEKGYKFLNWDKDTSFVTSNMTVAPVYELINYKIEYFNVDNNGLNPETYSVETNTITLKNPVREKMNFEGWYTDDGVWNSKVTEIPKGSVGDLSLYAKWKADVCKVKFVDNSYELIEEKEVEYDKGVIAPAAPSIDGYKFVNWDSDLTQVKKDIVVQAIYEPIDYDLTYMLDGGKLPQGISEKQKYNVLSGKIVLPKPAKDGCEFEGWYDSGNNRITFIREGYIGNIKLTAKWHELTDYEKWGDISAEDRAMFTDYTSVEDEFYIAGIADSYEYAGVPVTIPDVRVYFGKNKLALGTDYTVSYGNNKVPGEAVCQIKFKGNYKGIKQVPFKISAGRLNEAAVASGTLVVTDCYDTCDGKLKSPAPTVVFNGVTLKKGKDYDLEYPDKESGAYIEANEDGWHIRIVGKGSYYSVLEDGKPEYVESLLYMRSDDSVNINKAKVAGISKMTYDGQPKEQSGISITYNGNGLVKDKDYTLDYKFNIKPGTAYVIIRGTGQPNGFVGERAISFNIVAPKNSQKINLAIAGEDLVVEIPETVNYVKGGVTPQAKIIYKDVVLKEGTDYTISYKNNKAFSESSNPKKAAQVVVKGKGIYNGSVTKTFIITKQSFYNVTLNVADMSYSTKGGANKAAITIYDENGKKLAAGTDYDKNVKYVYTESITVKDTKGKEIQRHRGELVGKADVVPIGTKLKAIIKGCKNYTDDTISGYYYIKAQSIDKAKAVFANSVYAYTGKEIRPDKDDITITIGKDLTLTSSDYEIIGYYDNIAIGKGTIVVRGLGDYAGIKSFTFKIGTREVK